MKPTTAIPSQNKEVIVTFLNLLLADEYVLYTKTRTAHWNVDGLNNFELHVFLENQFNTLDEIIDEIAIRIRSLGHFALGSLKNFLSISQMSDDDNDLSNSVQTFEILMHDHESIIRMIHHETDPISQQFNDADTAELLSKILGQHQKMVWMLKSLLSKSASDPHAKKPIKSTQATDIQKHVRYKKSKTLKSP